MYRASWIARVHLEGYYDFYFDLLISFHSICPHIHTLIYCIICRVCTCLRLMMKHVIARNDPLFNAVNLFLALFRLIRCHILHPNSPPLPLLVVANTSKVNQKLHSQHQLANNNTVLLESVSAIFSHQHHGQSTCETNGKRRRCVAYAFSHLRPRCGGTF